MMWVSCWHKMSALYEHLLFIITIRSVLTPSRRESHMCAIWVAYSFYFWVLLFLNTNLRLTNRRISVTESGEYCYLKIVLLKIKSSIRDGCTEGIKVLESFLCYSLLFYKLIFYSLCVLQYLSTCVFLNLLKLF